MNKSYFNLIFAAVFLLLAGFATAKTNLIKIIIPETVSIELPRNWVLISNNQRITLDTWVESTLDLKALPNVDSNLPFAANYYVDGATAGIINARFYPTKDITQKDATLATISDIHELDQSIRTGIIQSTQKSGMIVTSWEGTEKRSINGVTAFVTEYHRKSLNGSGIFRVRLIRVFDGAKSFTLTVSYLEAQSFFLQNITDRIISSLAINGPR